jgi:hypothetical protein
MNHIYYGLNLILHKVANVPIVIGWLAHAVNTQLI